MDPVSARRSAFRRFVGHAFGGAMTPALELIAGDARLTTRQRKTLRGLLERKEAGDE